MANYAYIRVSTDKQDIENQRHGIFEYAHKKNIPGLSFIEDSVSSKKNWKDRGIGRLIQDTASEGDTIILPEISRAARTTLEVLEFAKEALAKGIELHIAKQNMVFDASINTTIQVTILGLAAEIERDFVSQRTTESIAYRRAQIKEKGYFLNRYGKKVRSLGRPKGKAKHHKLDKKEADIRLYLKKGVSKRSVAKIIGCASSTLYDWCKRKKL